MLNTESFLLGCLIALSLIACDKAPDSKPEPVEVGPPTFNIKDVWRIESKTCAGKEVAVKPHQAFKIDADHFVRIEPFSEDADSLCKIGYVYDRVIHTAETTKRDGVPTYNETAVLKGSQAKKSCWKKVNGAPVQPPSDEILSFGPEETAFNMTATVNTLLVYLVWPAECPMGFTRLVLKK